MDLSVKHIRRERDPFEVIFSAVFAVSGAVQLVSGAVPGSMAELLPGWYRYVWLAMVTLGSVSVLAGVYWRNRVSGLFIESWGLSAVAISVAFYGSGIMYVTIQSGNGASVLAGPLTIALGLAFWWKRVQLRRVIKELPTL